MSGLRDWRGWKWELRLDRGVLMGNVDNEEYKKLR